MIIPGLKWTCIWLSAPFFTIFGVKQCDIPFGARLFCESRRENSKLDLATACERLRFWKLAMCQLLLSRAASLNWHSHRQYDPLISMWIFMWIFFGGFGVAPCCANFVSTAFDGGAKFLIYSHPEQRAMQMSVQRCKIEFPSKKQKTINTKHFVFSQENKICSAELRNFKLVRYNHFLPTRNRNQHHGSDIATCLY